MRRLLVGSRRGRGERVVEGAWSDRSPRHSAQQPADRHLNDSDSVATRRNESNRGCLGEVPRRARHFPDAESAQDRFGQELVVEDEIVREPPPVDLFEYAPGVDAVARMELREFRAQAEVLEKRENAVRSVLVERHAAGQSAAAENAGAEYDVVSGVRDHRTHGPEQPRGILIIRVEHGDDVRVMPEGGFIAGFLVCAVPTVRWMDDGFESETSGDGHRFIPAGVVHQDDVIGYTFRDRIEGRFQRPGRVVRGHDDHDAFSGNAHGVSIRSKVSGPADASGPIGDATRRVSCRTGLYSTEFTASSVSVRRLLFFSRRSDTRRARIVSVRSRWFGSSPYCSSMKYAPDRIRNFAIIAHIDHGKSTLADRMLLHTHTIDERVFRDQVLDRMDLERERGITIKSHPVRMIYRARDGLEYELNLIDTPGHVDFSYEVSRSLAACEGALVVVDAAQGVQAQTVANTELALRQDLVLIPVINKIDLPAADVDACRTQIEEMLALPADEALLVSAKEDIGIDEVLEAVVRNIPPPPADPNAPLQALVFDSWYDMYRGVVAYVRVVAGTVRPGDTVELMSSGIQSEVKEVGIFTPEMTPVEGLRAGEVGYLITTIKNPADIRVGDTVTNAARRAPEPLPGFREVRPMVFSGIYPVDSRDFDALKAGIAKLRLNDPAVTVQQETSAALGAGFRCGFLGLLHMEIVQERLRREYGLDIIVTYPSVVFRVHMRDGRTVHIENPVHMPDPSLIDSIEEPMIRARIIIPVAALGAVMNLVLERRGTCRSTETVDAMHVLLTADLPLQEVIVDFYDRLKTVTRGYGSMDYEPTGYRPAPLVKLEILVNGEPVDAFAAIVHIDEAARRGRRIVRRLKEVIPPQLFQVPLQAAVGGKIVARETIRALRKNVTAKCYGGDITRKRKLLERQKEGKKRMRQFGRVHIPQEAFVAVLKNSE